MVNDTELFFAVAANEVWEVTISIRPDSGATPDIAYILTMPAGGDFEGLYIGRDNAEAISVKKISTGSMAAGGGFGAGTVYPAIIKGVAINAGNAGNFQLKWAQNVANASDTKVLTNSCIIAHRIA